MMRAILVSVACAVVLLAHEALAHHNMTALFDFNDRVTVNGTLTKIDWRNPHTYLTIDVQGAAARLRAGKPRALADMVPHSRHRQGGFRGQHGEEPQVELSRARDKSRSGLIRTITLPGGRVVSACPQNC